MNPLSETTIEGRLERITFYNQENHYLIGRLHSNESKSLVSILGYMPEPGLGQTLRVSGVWQTHPRFGQQFHFDVCEIVLPTDVADISAYLQAGMIKGLGPKTVDRIVALFKERTLEIIENRPDELVKVKGIGLQTAVRIGEAWKHHHAARSLMRFLRENSIKPAFGAKLMSLYGFEAEQILRNDPFRVAVDMPGSGFLIADRLIRNMDEEMPDPMQRARACLSYLVDQAVSEGHLFEFKEKLLDKAQKLFQIDPESGEDALTHLAENEAIVIDVLLDGQEGPAVYPARLHLAEITIAQRLQASLCIPAAVPGITPEAVSAAVLKRMAMMLSDQQQQALIGAVSNKTTIITGGPGTGKTTLIRAVTAVLESLGKRILLAAPTGRAARRVCEVTGKPATTLHKLLGLSIEGEYFEKDQDDPLDADAIIVDEASMIDTVLFCHLIKARPLTTLLILVGDQFQLPSVGPGSILSDLIGSGRIPAFELTEIFRQAQESPIIMNAHRIRKGQMPEISNHPQDAPAPCGFYFIEQGRPEVVVDTIAELCAEKIPDQFGFHPIEQIQVLTPMHKGAAGTLNLNRILQERLNPRLEKITAMGGSFGVGDKVIHLRNNYAKEVFNGEIGTVSLIDTKTEEVVVDYLDRRVVYDSTELGELALAYAISIHKSQGSEYPAVIVPLLTQHYVLLQRNLLYTAVTRAKELVILIGTTKALAIALGNDKPSNRRSGLAIRLKMP